MTTSKSNRVTRRMAIGKHDERNRVVAICIAVASLASATQLARGFDIIFDYSYDTAVFFGATEKNALESAASYFEGIIGDDFDAITPGGINTWDASFLNPETLSGTSVTDLFVPADSIIVYVGSTDLGGALGIAQPGGYSASGTAAFTSSVQTRGESGIITTTPTTDDNEFAPWGGSISFDDTVTWNFDDETGPGASGTDYDFRTVAIHEIGHVLGLGTAESYSALINGSNEFTGASAVAINGGVVPLTVDQHFAAATSSTVYLGGGSQTAIMVESQPPGTRREFTAVDAAALDDIGYDVVPEPTSALLLLAAGATFLFRRPRRVV